MVQAVEQTAPIYSNILKCGLQIMPEKTVVRAVDAYRA